MNHSQHFFMWRFVINYLAPLVLACHLNVKDITYADNMGNSCRGVVKVTYEDNTETHIDVTDCDGKFALLTIKVLSNI